MRITDTKFFSQKAETLAPLLLGKYLCRKINDEIIKVKITETEAYVGTHDTACHSYKGKTPRTKIMWGEGGTIYVYICYGIHYLFNIISGKIGDAEGVLIRSVEGAIGPGKVTKLLSIDKDLYGKSIVTSDEIWLEDNSFVVNYTISPRIGISYAEEKDRNALLRFTVK